MRRTLQVIAVAAMVAVPAVSIVVALDGDDRQGGSAPPLTSPQDVASESSGVTLALSRAEFSGTATFVELAARVSGANPNEATRVRIPAAAFVPGNLAPADLTAGILLTANRPAVVQRLRPVSAGGPLKIVVSYVDVDDGKGTRRVTGNWVLELKPPAGLAEALRTETLSPGAPVVAEGITVRPLSALRSTTETLVTISLEGPPGIEQLALPSLVGASVDGGPLFGARIAGGAGEPVTFSFPSTDFGAPVEVQFAQFAAAPVAGESSPRWVEISLASLLERQGVTGKGGEKAAVDTSDIAGASANETLVVTGIGFEGPSVRLIKFSLDEYLPDAAGATLTLADGTILSVSGSGSQTGRSPTGDIGQGASSFVTFRFNDSNQLLGTVRLTLGKPGSIINGRWQVGFTP